MLMFALFQTLGEALFAIALLVPFVFFAGCVAYLWGLGLCALPGRSKLVSLSPLKTASASAGKSESSELNSKDESSLFESGEPKRFVVLIPAHNEEVLIGVALASLVNLNYPKDFFDIVVIADNCKDATAKIAKESGAIALERFDLEKIGKGFALEWALERLLSANPEAYLSAAATFDAVVILDADTQVAPNLLKAFAQAINSGEKAMQARYEVLNPEESWRTRLMCCALSLVHIVKPLGRERLKLSDGLKGNGMCFTREVVMKVPWSGASITEDIEYALRICREGYRVAFLPGSAVWAQMPTTGAQSVTQRKRWEGGRYHLLFQTAPSLLKEGIRRKNPVLLDRAAELIIPPFAEMFAFPFLLMIVSFVARYAYHWQTALWYGVGFATLLLMQAVYLFGGMWIAKVPSNIAFSALCAPAYIVWKFAVYAVMLVTRSSGGWKRTERRSLD